MSANYAIAFDLDGTLIHSAPDLHAAANVMLAELGRESLTLDKVTSFVGNGVPKLVERCLAATGGPDPRGYQIFSTYYAAHPVDLTQPFPGVMAALQALQTDGYALGICTNKPEGPTRTILDHFGMTELFPSVIGGDTLPVTKPDAAPLNACFQGLEGAPLLYVGDSETDVATAVAAQIPFALFTEGYRKTPVADLTHAHAFDAFDALPDLVAHQSAAFTSN
ncbi:MAG: phosphoglycolate phosphatase [Pseudomonadota bacterium]